MTTTEKLTEMIGAAKREIEDAEGNLERLLADLRVSPRADKTTITPVVEDAFDKLRSARENLIALEEIVRGGA